MDNGYCGGLIVVKTAEFCYGKNWTLVFLIAMSRINQVFFVELGFIIMFDKYLL